MRVTETVDKYVEKERKSSAAMKNYDHLLAPFVEFCEKYELTHVRKLTVRKVKQYKKEQVRESENPVTLAQKMRTFKDFLRWAEDNTPARRGLADELELPHLI